MNNQKALNQFKSLKSEMRQHVRSWGKYAGAPQLGAVSGLVKGWQIKLERLADEPVAADPYFEKAVQALEKAWDVRDDVTRAVAWVKAAFEDLEAVGESKSTKSIDPTRVEWVGHVARIEGEHPAVEEVIRLKRIAERASVRGQLEKRERDAIRESLEDIGDTYVEARAAAKSALGAIGLSDPNRMVDALDNLGISLYQSVLEKGETIEELPVDRMVARKGLSFIETIRSRVGIRRVMPTLAKKAYQLCDTYEDKKGKQLARALYNTAKAFDTSVKSNNLTEIETSIENMHRDVDALEAHWRQLLNSN